jgi:predicted lipase
MAEFHSLGALSDVSGFIAIDDTRKSIVISFQGSVGFQDILAIDANADRDSTDLCKGQPTTNILDRCGVHSGFMGQWEVAQMFVVESLAKAYKTHPSYQVVVTGHSMGGAVAAIAATYLRNLGYNVNLVCCTDC